MSFVNAHTHEGPRTGENSVAGPGIGALLAQLIWAIADEGAGVLLSAVSQERNQGPR
jgi:hypothetical protein